MWSGSFKSWLFYDLDLHIHTCRNIDWGKQKHFADYVSVCFYCLLVILSIMLTAVKMLPNNHKIAHNVVQTTILFTFYPLSNPTPIVSGRYKNAGYTCCFHKHTICHILTFVMPTVFNRFQLHCKHESVWVISGL